MPRADLETALYEREQAIYLGSFDKLLVNDVRHLRSRPRLRMFVAGNLVTNASPRGSMPMSGRVYTGRTGR